jgi:hypothetical protein
MTRYLIQLAGQVDLTDLNPWSPHQMTLVRMEPHATWIEICTDQAGMLGLITHLHRLGLTIASVQPAAGMNEA